MIFTARLHLLVEEDIGILVFLKFELGLRVLVLTTIPLFLYLLRTDLVHEFVVETVPLVIGFHQRIVVPSFRCP